MGKFKDWLETADVLDRKPGEVAGPKPDTTAKVTQQATNDYVAANPTFLQQVTTAPNPKAKVGILGKGAAQVLKTTPHRGANMTPDILSRGLAQAAGLDIKQLFPAANPMDMI